MATGGPLCENWFLQGVWRDPLMLSKYTYTTGGQTHKQAQKSALKHTPTLCQAANYTQRMWLSSSKYFLENISCLPFLLSTYHLVTETRMKKVNWTRQWTDSSNRKRKYLLKQVLPVLQFCVSMYSLLFLFPWFKDHWTGKQMKWYTNVIVEMNIKSWYLYTCIFFTSCSVFRENIN